MICNNLKECVEGQLISSSIRDCSNHNMNKCIESSDSRSSIKCEEKKKKYVLENTKKNHVISYKMDGGVIVEDRTVPHNTNKCDYLFVINDTELTAILTELKGVDVRKSLEQITGTMQLYKDVFKKFERIYARSIVTSSTPNLKATPAYTNLERMLRQNYNGNIKICERQFFEKDIELDKK